MCAASDDLEELRNYVNKEISKRLEADITMAEHIGEIITEIQKLQEKVAILENVKAH